MNDRDEQRVIAGLQALKQEARSLEAPPSLEQELLRAFRARRRPTKRRRWLWVPAAVAAGLAVGLWFGLRPAPIEPLPGLGASLRFSPAVAEVPVTKAPAERRAPRHRVTVAKHVPPKRELVEQRRPPEVATDFLPMHPALPSVPDEALQVVRISLPRTEMLRFGLPVVPGPRGARVKADVILGEDGIARAIRFVK